MPGYSLSDSNESLQIDVFLDPHCSDSRNFWNNLKDVLNQSIDSSNVLLDKVSMKLHMYGLPYHHNSFMACMMLNFFESKSPNEYLCFLDRMFSNLGTYNSGLDDHSKNYIEDQLILDGKDCLNRSDSKIENVYDDSQIFLKARYDFKFANKKGIFDFPTILVNDFPQDISGMNSDQLFDFFKSLIKSNNSKTLRKMIQDS